jgi:hypothetical protein
LHTNKVYIFNTSLKNFIEGLEKKDCNERDRVVDRIKKRQG